MLRRGINQRVLSPSIYLPENITNQPQVPSFEWLGILS
jgi:hypothetical protein